MKAHRPFGATYRFSLQGRNGHVFENLRCDRRRDGGEQSVFVTFDIGPLRELCVQPGSRSQVGRSGILIPAGTRDIFLQNLQTSSEAYPAFSLVGTAVLSRV